MWFAGLLYVLALAIVALTQWIYNWYHPPCDGQLPPGSLGLPLIGETIQFIAPSKSLDIPRFMKHRIHKYGPLFKTSLAGRPVVVSADANFNHYILQQEGKLVELWYLDSFAKLFGQNGIDKEGSTTAIGHVHKYLRNLVLANFGPESLKDNLFHKLEDMANKGLLSCCKKDSVDIKRELSRMIFDTTAKEMFGYDPETFDENLSDNFTNFMQSLMSFPLNIPGTAYHRCWQNQKRVMMIIKRVIEERRQMSPEERRGDLLDHVMEDMKRETFLTDEFVAVVVFGLLLASFETLASTLTLAFKLLADHPQVMQQLVEENEGVIIMNREAAPEGLTWKKYKSMTFTHQVLNELLRMASVAPGILRKVIKDVHINGYTIPEGWAIMVVPSILQLNPDTYKDPLAFNPSRWKNMGENFTAKNFIPFGGGSRSCAGAEFSKALMTVFLHVLVTKYRWTEVKAGEVTRSPVLGFGKGHFIRVTKKETVYAVK